ncbi:hypothetical protein, partial [Vibrio sp. 10N.261.55.A7]|uniref:hypothetical protein n=1 Tax=Vibrio sp. 10N.261.55.A7 TaxID=1880851 RepID=UPI00130014D4
TYLNYEVSLSGEAFGEVNTFLDITGTASDADLGAVQIKLPNGEWQDYDEVNGFQTPDSGVVKVRVEVLDDSETETRESVIVTATTDSNHVNAQSASAQ